MLTGEPFPRKVPADADDYDHDDEKDERERDFDDTNERKRLYAGCVIKSGEAYCLIEKTGLRTEIGKAAQVRLVK